MSDDGSQKCVQSVEFLVRAYSEWRSMCSSHHPELKLKQLGDFDDLEMWLDRFHPA